MKTDFLSDLVITNVVSATTMYNEKNSKAKRTNRSLWAVVVKYEGESRYVSDGTEHISDINNIMILPGGSCYEWKCTKTGHYVMVEFECELRCKCLFSFNVKNGTRILNMLRKIEYKSTLNTSFASMENIRDLYSVILMLIQSDCQKYIPDSKRNKLLPAMEYIAKNYTTEIRNDTLAALANMSTVYFRKLFSQVYGTSPIAYVHSLRIQKAGEILRSDYGSITDIAFSLGYSSIYDFSRDFKKHTGLSPSEYACKYK